ncbi:DUF3313 domain-containing protein [Bradyrhizobium sp. WBAH10]|uniref:DUF3313 domain-containing protein n=1 Tax=Bradyrhizobium sp. WBAH10 TaxID=1390116 RepID=UPI00155F0826|nr:DUF3313 domain-containing protein [Bradyrhizobium sp. WBAH10]MDD1520745.1 DUF3313 domain-containing protein [Bradyrhizobium sp. WBAH30]MDD1545796.1 DUF3313 domain-containing protein [Bradyrhizobium sp. WBAH41]MDD1558943.1 DUF3313 domain-containing protein [Bradyrhizobium sp. WBAH23]MDD1566407.1 DUF3313 domain-containing protein [Bradyrhizobium sp. WBAH33]MDD1592000.1 DUF3313 domain-containing protein [Bradyrhizobium sp. WBAH42]QCJ93011.1 DUF3313 domain-containing protein [Bradyrhizobium yu
MPREVRRYLACGSLAFLLPLAACATAPLSQSGALSSYDNLTSSDGVLTKSRVRVDKPDVLAAKTVRIAPASVASGALPANFSDEQRKLVLNAVDRALCVKLSDRLRVVNATETADLTVHATITHAEPTDKVAAGASKAVSIVPSVLSIPVPVPRLPVGLGSLSVEAEARDRSNQQKAALIWARGADSITSRPKVSEASDAYDLASAFGEDFGTLVATGESPFGKGPSLPSMQKIRSDLGGAHENSACDAFGRSPGVAGLVGGGLGLPPEWTDKGGNEQPATAPK